MKKSLIFLVSCMFLAAAVLLGGGCGDADGARKLQLLRGGEQFVLPQQEFAPLLLEYSGAGEGVRIRAEVLPGSDLKLPGSEFKTDAGGMVRIPVRAGGRLGDQYLRLTPEGDDSGAITVRLVTGMTVTGNGQEGRAGRMLPEPITVHLTDAAGNPVAGRPVWFELQSAPAGDGAALSHTCALTDRNGDARTFLQLNQGTGRYQIAVKPAGEGGAELLTRGVVIEAMGMNPGILFLNAFAGLAIFIFGMQLMSDGLQKAAGERMRSILHFFSRNRVVALLAGAGVTTVIQSSSACTVMVIGFINAGLLNLSQSIGIIIGSNIGTTITAQIVSFDIGALAMPAIIAGVLLSFTRGYWRGIGETVLGFGFLFFGMTIMSDELSSIGTFPSVTEIFRTFDCTPQNGIMPFGAVLGALAIGLIVTLVIQSSSASTGIIIALGAGGLINLYTAMPLVLGANIGTTITAQLAAIPANRVAKQAALAHTLFNVIGTVVMLIFFYVPYPGSEVPVFYWIVDWLTPGSALGETVQNVPRHIANGHTLFNVFTALLLLPFTGSLAAVCEKLLPNTKKRVKYIKLEPHLLENPAIALQQAATRVRSMVRSAWKLTAHVWQNELCERNEIPDEEFHRRAGKIERAESEVTAYLVELMRHGLSSRESEWIPLLTGSAGDAGRLADYAAMIHRETRRLGGEKLPRKPAKELAELFLLLDAMAAAVQGAFETGASGGGEQVRQQADAVRRKAELLEINYVENLKKGDYSAESGVVVLALAGVARQIGDRLEMLIERAEKLRF